MAFAFIAEKKCMGLLATVLVCLASADANAHQENDETSLLQMPVKAAVEKSTLQAAKSDELYQVGKEVETDWDFAAGEAFTDYNRTEKRLGVGGYGCGKTQGPFSKRWCKYHSYQRPCCDPGAYCKMHPKYTFAGACFPGAPPTPPPTSPPTPAPTSASPTPSGSEDTYSGGDWQHGHATFYGNPTNGGACGAEIGNYGPGTWIDGLHVATSSYMFCGKTSACGAQHAFDCGHCYEVKCTGSDYMASACKGGTVTVSVTNECPDVGHCDGTQKHFDLTTKAFELIASKQAGVISIDFRQVACSPGSSNNAKLVIKNGSSRWHLECAVKDLGGVGSVEKLEVNGQALNPIYGQFWQRASDMGNGPYTFKITAEDGQVIEYTTPGSSLPIGDIDLGTNIS